MHRPSRKAYDKAFNIPSLPELMAMDIKRRVEDAGFKKKAVA
jgi:hypothetical protein